MKGFTLVELVIILAILLLLFAIVGSLSSNTLPKSQLLSSAETVVQTLRRAQALSIAGKHDSLWGVYLTASDITLFAGSSYATRNTEHDQREVFPAGITVSGISEVVFEAITGETSNPGTIMLVADATGQTSTITIYASGLIEN